MVVPIYIPNNSVRGSPSLHTTPEFIVCAFLEIICFLLQRVSVAVFRLSLVTESRGHSLLWCTGFSLLWLLLLHSTGSGHTGFSSCSMQTQQLWHMGFSCSMACEISRDQGSDPCPLHWQVNSYLLYYKESPVHFLMIATLTDVSWYFIVVLIFISLKITSFEHLFMCLLAICMSSMKKWNVYLGLLPIFD